MDFRYKCALQSLFSILPRGERLNFYFQRYLTRNLPVDEAAFLGKVGCAVWYEKMYQTHHKIESSDGEIDKKYYEFGAGADMIIPLTMSQLGYEVYAIDIRHLFESYLVKDTLQKFDNTADQLPFSLKKWSTNSDLKRQLLYDFHFHYQAPEDARRTTFEDCYFDCTSSTSVFEHVPKADLLSILQETYRILKPGGICSMIIDYRDHWSFFDEQLSVYHFLQYEEQEWKKYNPALHYQNRLRHIDYLTLIEQTDYRDSRHKNRATNKRRTLHFSCTAPRFFLSKIYSGGVSD